MMCDPAPLLADNMAGFTAKGADAVIGETPIDPASGGGLPRRKRRSVVTSTKVQMPLSPFDIFPHGAAVVRRSVFERLGGFDARFTSGAAFGSEDADSAHACSPTMTSGTMRERSAFSAMSCSPASIWLGAKRAAAAHIRFARKHPELAREFSNGRAMLAG